MARVLVVEDNAINLALMQYLLQALGHEVLAARDGEEALAVLHAARPDAVVCDIEMPRMDGVEFARAVRQDPAFAGLVLLAVTSNAMVGDRDRFMSAGFDDYQAKPIDPVRFGPWLEGHLRHAPAGQAAEPHAATPAPETAAPTGPLILVVDDEPVNLNLKRSSLEPLGYRVLTASSAGEAFALALAQAPALIISDVGMPEGDGFEFICRVKQAPALHGIPFIFISMTHWDEAAREKALALGALRYLRRPLPAEDLLAEVASALRVGQAGPR